MNKTFLLLGAVTLSASLSASDFGGYSVVEMHNDNTNGTSTVERVYTNASGSILFLGDAASVGATPSAYISSVESPTAPFKEYMKQTNTNLVFGEINKEDATPLWIGTSNRGNIKSKAAVATDNGELYLAVVACHTDSNRLADDKALQIVVNTDSKGLDSVAITGVYDSKNAYQYGGIFCASHTGVKTVCALGQVAGQTACFSIVDLATDGTNLYLLTVLTKGIAIDKDTILAKSAKGSLAVLKISADGKLLASVVSEGTEGKTTGTLKYIDGKLYYAGNFAAQANGTFSWGGKTLTSSAANNGILAATLSTDLACEQLSYTGIEKNTAGNGGTLTVYDELVDGENAYFAGFFNGQIPFGETDTIGATATRGFVMKVNLTTGKAEKAACIASAGITGAAALCAHNDTISAYAYDWKSSNRISLYHFDTNLQPVDTTALVIANGMEAIKGAILTKNGQFVYAFRTKANVTFAADSTQTYTAQDGGFRGVIAIENLYAPDKTGISDAVAPAAKAVKFFRNGQLYIRRGDKTYNALGQEL